MGNVPPAKFSVAEQIILVCEDYPEDNGVYTIINKEFSNDFAYFDDRSESLAKHEAPQWYYLLDNGEEFWYQESDLRKKHDGSSFSFSQLMTSLKQPSLIDN